MTTLLPTSQSTGVEAYEDMFKEITRKLYGDEATAHGLYPHNTQVAQLAPGAPSAPPDGGERSFTTLTQIGYEAATGTGQQQQQQQQQQQHPQQAATGDAFKAGEHISTAFGLAALMQGGFPPPGTILNPVNFPPGTSKTPTNISGPSSEDRWAGGLHQQQGSAAEEQGSWHAGKHSAGQAASSYRGKSYKKPKTERHDGGSPVTAGSGGLNIPSTADRSKGNNGGASGGYSATGASTSTATATATGTGGGVTPVKRYTCSSCPYTTDRRDLFTRHENIHKEEKPFQCYACLKPFNRADHVKKHFLRMHRELEYDIAKTRRYPPGTSSSSTSSSSSTAAAASASAGSSGTKSGAYYSSAANGSGGGGGGGTHASTVTSTSSAAASSSLAAMPLNIPSSGSYTSGGGGGLSSHVLDHHAMLNSGHSSHLLQLQQAHHQQQQQQLQQQHHNVQTSPHALQSISVKQEKTTTLLNTSGSSVGSLGEDKSFPKKVKGEKKFSCAFCPWAGTDNWGLKRHLNTHTKPYVCLLCDYKAARSERLATHVFKVHNRKACGKCNFIADDQSQLDAHLHEAHPHEATKASNISNNNSSTSNNSNGGKCGGAAPLTQHQHPLHHHHHHHHHSQHLPPPALPPPSVSAGGVVVPSGSNSSASSISSNSSSNSNAAVLRNLGNAFPSNNLPTNIPTTGNGFGNGPSNGHYHATNLHHAATGNVLTNSNAANLIDTINQHLAATTAAGTHQHQQQHQQQQQHHQNHHNRIGAWRRRRGAELLYSYLEADGSDSGDYARLLHMQAVGRNKASVTQDFHNAGGGDYNGINGHASPPSSSSSPSAKATTMDRKNGANTEGSDGGSVKIPATSSLASLLGGDQLSFLQLLATAAVAQQHLQLQSGQHNKKQQQQQHQQPHLIQPKQPSMTNGSYSSPMASSPPATSTPHQHQHNSNNAHSTNGGTLVAAQPLPLVKRRRTTNNELSNDKENLLYRKTAMSGDVIVNNTSLIANGVTIAATASLPTITNGRNGVKNGHHHHHNHHHHNNNNNNNNNSSTNNKNINDIFDKVYKKPQSTFAKQQQPILRTAPPSAIEEDGTGPPPPPVATDYTDPANQCGTEKFSLAEFLKNHTEVSISTVGGAAVTNTGKEHGKANRTAPPPLSSPSIDEEEGHDSSCSGSSSSSSSTSSRKRKTDNGERNPRKQQQPRRIDEFKVVEPVAAVKTEPSPSPSTTPPPAPAQQAEPRPMLKILSPAEVVSKLEERKERDLVEQRLSEPEEEEEEEEQEKKVKAEKSSTEIKKSDQPERKPADEANTQNSPSKLADIRDKHMIQLVTRRLCCRICQHKGALEHLDNCHYHSKISLLLHTRWRHQQERGNGGSPIRCRQCDIQFPRRYKLILHQKLTGHKGAIDKSVNGGGTEQDAIMPDGGEDQGHDGVLPKKQRKRKPRSQCFTRRRK